MSDLPALPAPSSWWLRSLGAVATLTRASLSAMGVGSQSPGRPGASYGMVASRPLGEEYLRQMAEAPAVYGGLLRRTGTLGAYPIVVLRNGVPVDPLKEPWVTELLALLQSPDPDDEAGLGDPENLCPVEPGEGLFAQLAADLLMTGVAYAIPTAGDDHRLLGLTRAHPRQMKLLNGGLTWRYTLNGVYKDYARRAVFCIRQIGWEANGQGELGTGAGAVLAPIVAAERTAMLKTAQIIDQGGADVIVTSTSPAGNAFLNNPVNRDRLKGEMERALAMKDGGRVVVIAGDLAAKPSGLTPADIQAPELTTSARASELMALGVTPVSIGGESANYATAALQYRVQAELDEALADKFEAYMLRPLAQHYARLGKRSRADIRATTARFDLSTHPGYAYARTEAIDRMTKLVDLGYSTEQAAQIEAQSFPKPAGLPRARATAPTSGTPNPEPAPLRSRAANREPADAEVD